MQTLIDQYGVGQLFWIVGSIFLLGMAKGGFPIGAIALPLLVLGWPNQAGAARQVAAFMLPLLCLMDVIAILFYRRHIQWRRILPLLPGTLAGVVLAAVLFLGRGPNTFVLSDRWLKLAIGIIGILFVAYQACRQTILRRLEKSHPSWRLATGFGVAAGVTSTVAHAAGPVAQMYFLPQNLDKMGLAATTAGFFFLLNLVKLVPYATSGQFQGSIIRLAVLVLPVIPVGVALGYGAVRWMKSETYRLFIYAILLGTSLLLVYRALAVDQ